MSRERHQLLPQAGGKTGRAAVTALLAAVLPVLVSQAASLYLLRVLTMIGFYTMLGLSLNLMTGYLGEVSLGHGAFYAVGAYAVSILTVDAGWAYWPAVVAAIVLCGCLGALLSFATMRVSGTYLAVLTLAFFYLVMNVIQNWDSLTHGAVGIYNIPPANVFGIAFTMRNSGYFYCIYLYVIMTIMLTYLLVNSKFGRAMKAIREDRLAASMVGISVQAYRVLAYALAGMLAGLAGTLYGPFLGYINYLSFTYDLSLIPLVIVIAGGRGTIRGVVAGALLVSPLGEVLRAFTTLIRDLSSPYIAEPEQLRFVIYGLILILVTRLRPQGLLGGKRDGGYTMPRGFTGGGDG